MFPRPFSIVALVLLAGCDDAEPVTTRATTTTTTSTTTTTPRFIPRDEVEQRYVEGIEERVSELRIERIEGDRLRVTWGDNEVHEVNLMNLREECRRSSATCGDSINTWVESLTAEEAPLAAENIRMVLMGERLMRQQGHSALDASQPFAGDLLWHYVNDTPTTIGSLRAAAIEEAGLDLGTLEGIARANMRRAFGPLRYAPLADAPALVYAVDSSAAGYLSDSYDNSRLLLHDSWRPVVEQVRGDLIAVAPARDIVLFCGREEAGALALLSYLAEQMIHGEPHPISTQLIRWTPSGWVPFTL